MITVKSCLPCQVATTVYAQSDVTDVDDEIPLRWEVAVRGMITKIFANPPDSVYEGAMEEIRYFRPHINVLLKDFSEDQKASMFEDLIAAMTKAILQRSRIPIKHRLSNAAIGVIVDYLGAVPSKKTLTPEMIDRAKSFTDALLVSCRADRKCKRFAER